LREDRQEAWLHLRPASLRFAADEEMAGRRRVGPGTFVKERSLEARVATRLARGRLVAVAVGREAVVPVRDAHRRRRLLGRVRLELLDPLDEQAPLVARLGRHGALERRGGNSDGPHELRDQKLLAG